MPKDKTITVSGVTFTAEQIKSAVVHIEGRDIEIGELGDKKRRAGFCPQDKEDY